MWGWDEHEVRRYQHLHTQHSHTSHKHLHRRTIQCVTILWEERAVGRAYRIGQQKPLPLSRQSKRAHWITMLVDAANDTSSSASPEMDASLQKLQGSFNPMNTTSTSRYLSAAGSEDQSIRKFAGPIDREATAKAAYCSSALQVAPQRAPSIPSSVGECENHSSPAAFQVASTPGFPSHIADQAFSTSRWYVSLGACLSALANGESYRQTIIHTDFEFFFHPTNKLNKINNYGARVGNSAKHSPRKHLLNYWKFLSKIRNTHPLYIYKWQL